MSQSTVTLATVTSIFESAVNGDLSAYTSAEQGTKSKVRAQVEKSIKEALRAKEFETAGDLQDVLDSLVSAKISKESAKIDFAQVIADKIANLRLAADMLESGAIVPEGIEPESVVDLATKITAALADKEAATKIASAKITKSSDRVDIEAHVAEVIADVESGTFLKISEVAKVRTEAAPEGLPSQGALAARLFAKGGCTLDGVEPVEATATAPKGLRVL